MLKLIIIDNFISSQRKLFPAAKQHYSRWIYVGGLCGWFCVDVGSKTYVINDQLQEIALTEMISRNGRR